MNDDLMFLARTIYGEARNQGVEGMTAVAWVVKNRMADRRWPNTARGVCLARKQFSCWNHNDPNRDRLVAVDETDRLYRTCMTVAYLTLGGMNEDPTGGATHYLNKTTVLANGPLPSWATEDRECAVIGDHTFYKYVP